MYTFMSCLKKKLLTQIYIKDALCCYFEKKKIKKKKQNKKKINEERKKKLPGPF